jgi:hypothetical protein
MFSEEHIVHTHSRSGKTSQMIAGEIALLAKLTHQVPRETALGDSNFDALCVQMEVLQFQLNFEQVDARYKRDQSESYVWLCARFACEWLHEGAEAPSEDWLTMLYPDFKSSWVN